MLATKFHGTMGDDPNQRGNSRRWIFRAVEDSLRRLDTDWIDLYQVHRPEPDTDIDETLGALTDLVHAGKVRYHRLVDVPAAAIVEAQWTAERRDRERFVCEQPPYSMFVRGDRGATCCPTCAALRHGRASRGARSPAAGCPAGTARAPTSRRSSPGRRGSRPATTCRRRRTSASSRWPTRSRSWPRTPASALIHLAIAFVIRHPAVTSAIIGPRTMEQLESQLGAADVVLADDVLDRIDEIAPPGRNINPADAGYTPPALSDPALRRRRTQT